MPSRKLLANAQDVPPGGHALGFYTTRREAAALTADFLRGTPNGQAARVWVPDEQSAALYAEAAGDRAPAHVGCVAILPAEQVEEQEGKLRPVGEIRAFLASHPEGVSAGADTISFYWTPATVPAHLEYEAWFAAQPRARSRFLCPYDLRSIAATDAPRVVHELAAHHSHVVLADASEPGARLLQLFVPDTVSDLPDALDAALGWAVKHGYVEIVPKTRELRLTPAGDEVVRAWGERPAVDRGGPAGTGAEGKGPASSRPRSGRT